MALRCSIRNKVRSIPGARHASIACVLTLLLLFLPACLRTSSMKTVRVETQDEILTVRSSAQTVRALLMELDIVLGPDDRIEPDLWRETVDYGTVHVIRVNIRESIESREIPFEQKIIRSEAMSPGERRLLQLGAVGREEVVYREIYENGVQQERYELLRRVVEPPVDEIISVGIQSNLPSQPIPGTLAYISAGNAWVMRETSGSRRPLTSSGDLDGRVFILSPDGDWLLYSRVEEAVGEPALNSLWIIGTAILNEQPQAVGVEGAIYAEWFNDGRSFLYSTAERSGSSPGWRARNDLWKAELHGLTPAGRRTGTETITTTLSLMAPPPAEEWYSWWGTSFSLSPDNRRVAFGRPDSIGYLDLATGEERSILRFAVYHTYGDWVWVPELDWSPDGRFIVCSTHGPPVYDGTPEDSPIFDVWIVERMGDVGVKIAPEAGMWAAPSWSPVYRHGDGTRDSSIAYGVARLPLDSHNSRYDLFVMDRDGSNRIRLFPPAGREGLVAPDLSWSPDGRQLVLAHEGNLYLLTPRTGSWAQLTGDGHSAQPRWAGKS